MQGANKLSLLHQHLAAGEVHRKKSSAPACILQKQTKTPQKSFVIRAEACVDILSGGGWRAVSQHCKKWLGSTLLRATFLQWKCFLYSAEEQENGFG
jgi:hypothetical protein